MTHNSTHAERERLKKEAIARAAKHWLRPHSYVIQEFYRQAMTYSATDRHSGLGLKWRYKIHSA